jgi:hypothetical protein
MIFSTTSLNSVLISMLGIVFLFIGTYIFVAVDQQVFGIGMAATALGCMFCGMTNGFADRSPRGYAYRRLGMVAFAIGIPVIAISAWRLS